MDVAENSSIPVSLIQQALLLYEGHWDISAIKETVYKKVYLTNKKAKSHIQKCITLLHPSNNAVVKSPVPCKYKIR